MSPSSQASERHFENAALFEFSSVVNASLDLRFILNHTLLTLMGRLLSGKGMVLIQHPGGGYRVETVKGFPPEIEGKEVRIGRMPRSVVDLQRATAGKGTWLKFLREAGARLIVPLHIGTRPVGMLVFGPRMAGKRLLAREVTYIHSLANIAATAIDKCHTIEELRQVNRRLDRKIQEMNTLFDLGKEFSAVLDRDKLVRLLVFSLLGQIGVNRYLICLREEEGEMAVVASRLDGPVPQRELLGTLVRAKAPQLLENIVVTGAVDPREPLTSLGLVVAVPMRLHDENRGLILLGGKLNREEFSAEDFEYLSALGSLAIIALENARLFAEAIEAQRIEDELLIAREIQKGLLPSVLPRISGICVAAANFSSRQVGGDYYDVIALDQDRFIIAIGDVSGKGTPASLLMANLQAAIRALVPLDLPLAELTGRVNRLMCRNTGGNKFVTFFWGCIHQVHRTLRYVNAGHNHPYLFRADGLVERLDRGGMILGVLDSPIPYEEGEVSLGAGDLLVLFTDGVSEAMDPDNTEYGEPRLENVIRAHRHFSPQEIIETVQRDIQEHARGAPQSDDITMMVLSVTG